MIYATTGAIFDGFIAELHFDTFCIFLFRPYVLYRGFDAEFHGDIICYELYVILMIIIKTSSYLADESPKSKSTQKCQNVIWP